MKKPQNKLRMGRGCGWGGWGVVIALCASLGQCPAQGTLTRITFDGPPEFERLQLFYSYSESGMVFTAILDQQGYGGFGRINKWRVGDYPFNGTAYIYCLRRSPVHVTSLDGLFFDLISVDLAEDSSLDPRPATVQFLGYRADGSAVTASFTTDGIIGVAGVPDFQTFHFGPEFRSGLLSRVIIQAGTTTVTFALDNLNVYIVPEPSSWALLGVGGLLAAWRLRHRARTQAKRLVG